MLNKNLITITILASLLGGCKLTVDDIVEKVESNKVAPEKKISHSSTLDNATDSLALSMENIGEEKSGYYVNTKNKIHRKKVNKLPFSFTKNITYKTEDPLDYRAFSTDMYKATGVKISFESLLKNNLIQPINFKEGTIEEFFNLVAISNDIKWKYDHKKNTVFFYLFDTKEFKINDQYFLDDESIIILRENIRTIMSEYGTLVINPEQGIVSVEDNDFSLLKISRYLEELDKSYNTSVYVTVKSYKISVDNSKSIGELSINDFENEHYSVADPDGISSSVFSSKKNKKLDSFISKMEKIGTVKVKESSLTVKNNSESNLPIGKEGFINVMPKVIDGKILLTYNLKIDGKNISQKLTSENGDSNIVFLNQVKEGNMTNIQMLVINSVYEN